MNYNDELMRYQDDAEERYDNYNSLEDHDYEEDDFDSGMEGLDEYDNYDDDEFEEHDYMEVYDEQDYDDYRRSSIGSIDANDRTLTVTVKNTTDESKTAVIFGGNQEVQQVDGVTVEVEESSHKEVREESKSNPFKIVGLKYSVSDALQFDNVLKIVNKTASGTITTRVWQPRNSSSPQNFDKNMVDSGGFAMNVSGQSSIQLTINAQTTAVFTFTIKVRANMGNLLKGRNVAELSRTPRATGLPQIDMLQRRRRKRRSRKPRVIKSTSRLKRR
ncbi:hypothetical protein [Aquimarina longa]|uniref:hypothetical protein n=1 Tax=Aquimarina longa TaxID=1080221 RepID=UPI0007835994|nr:hypothetical protein [Aquimarina longa]